MDKQDFINRLFMKHATSYDKSKVQILSDDYKKYLSDTIDFEKTYDNIATHWSKSSIPQIADILEYVVYKPQEKCVNSLYWTIIGSKNGYPYEFACEMSESLETAKSKLRMRGLEYVSNNRMEIKLQYGI